MIAVDWGTSSFRAYRLDADGAVLARRERPRGIAGVPAGRFPQVLAEEIGDWLAAGAETVVLCGMVGSRQGWVEVPYCECPAGAPEIAARLQPIDLDGATAYIVPGVSGFDIAGVHDVMRGEETQILGAMDALPGEAVVCLPGTHSKWVRVREARIAGFSTHFTGEAFAVLKGHSLLGRMIEDGAPDEAAFLAGLARSAEPEGLLHHLFGVRAKALFGELSGAGGGEYLSGLLIGHELRNALRAAGDVPVFVLGAPGLVARYALALRALGVEPRLLDAESAVKGMRLLARAASGRIESAGQMKRVP
jgi:2-dehydro-3-deoxygalactonokinase